MALIVLLAFSVMAMAGRSLAEVPEIANPQLRSFLETYDRSKPPPNAPVTAFAGLYVNSFTTYEQESLIELVIYFRVSWKDTRLTGLFTEADQKDKAKDIEFSAHKYIWKPDLFFRNQREVVERGSIANEALLRVNSSGNVWYATAQVNTYQCHGLSRRFTYKLPTVTCKIFIESFKHTEKTLKLKFLKSAFAFDKNILMPEFTLTNSSAYDCSHNYSVGRFPCLEIRLDLKRDAFIDHVGNVMYISSTLLLVAAWASFWLDGIRQIQRRLSLCLGTTVVLVLELGAAATWYEEWDLMGNKAQFWLAFCTLMSTIVLCETTVVHIAMVNIVNKIKGTYPSTSVQMTSEGEEMEKSEGTVGRIIDVLFGIILYPAVFIIFIFVFFIKHYLNIKSGQ